MTLDSVMTTVTSKTSADLDTTPSTTATVLSDPPCFYLSSIAQVLPQFNSCNDSYIPDSSLNSCLHRKHRLSEQDSDDDDSDDVLRDRDGDGVLSFKKLSIDRSAGANNRSSRIENKSIVKPSRFRFPRRTLPPIQLSSRKTDTHGASDNNTILSSAGHDSSSNICLDPRQSATTFTSNIYSTNNGAMPQSPSQLASTTTNERTLFDLTDLERVLLTTSSDGARQGAEGTQADGGGVDCEEGMEDCTMDELSCYFDDFCHIPKKMSMMAEMMYT